MQGLRPRPCQLGCSKRRQPQLCGAMRGQRLNSHKAPDNTGMGRTSPWNWHHCQRCGCTRKHYSAPCYFLGHCWRGHLLQWQYQRRYGKVELICPLWPVTTPGTKTCTSYKAARSTSMREMCGRPLGKLIRMKRKLKWLLGGDDRSLTVAQFMLQVAAH